MGDGRSRRHARTRTNRRNKTKQTTKQTRSVRCMFSRKVERRQGIGPSAWIGRHARARVCTRAASCRIISKRLAPRTEPLRQTWDNEYETPEPDSLSLYLWASGLNSCIASLLSLLHSRHTAHVLPPLLPVLVHGPLHRSTHQPPRFVQHGVDGSP